MGYSWTCKTCDRHATLGGADYDFQEIFLCSETTHKAGQGIEVSSTLMKCPNPACGALELVVSARHVMPGGTFYQKFISSKGSAAGVGKFQFLPTTSQPLSGDVPPSIQDDYREANLIRTLSPKASATLARRALQGMVRDFWGVAKSTLAAELKAIEDKCDPELYGAMMALKSIGNIGAHPERDISTIIDIEHDEAQQLIDLIHLLDDEWYRTRAARKARIQAVTSLAVQKNASTPK